MTLRQVPLKEIKKLLKNLKNTRSTSIDGLDNFAVKLAAEVIAGPLHHVVVLSINQNKFPTAWKYSEVMP